MSFTKERALELIDKHQCAGLIMNINEFVDIFQWSGECGFDPVVDRDILQTGLYGYLYGKKLLVSKVIRPGEVYPINDSFIDQFTKSGFAIYELVQHLVDEGWEDTANILRMNEALG